MASSRYLLYSIGIDEFDTFQTLSCCTKDAQVIADAFNKKVPGITIKVLSTGKNADGLPSRLNIDDCLTDIKQSKLDKKDHIVFYFAGHGYSFEGKDYIVCSDTKRGDNSSSIETDKIIQSINASGAGTGIIIIDACRKKISRDNSLFGEHTEALARRQGVIAFFGCSPDEVCQELPKYGNGIFTYSFVSCLNKCSSFTPIEIDKYVVNQVQIICQEEKLDKQTPYTAVFPVQKSIMDILTGSTFHISTESNRCIIIVGPPNAGKTTLGKNISSELGYFHVEMSDFAYKRFTSCEDYSGSVQDFMEEVVWKENEKDVIARDVIDSLKNIQKPVISGPRTVEEIETLKRYIPNCLTIYLFANAQLRFKRYETSGKMDRYRLSYKEQVQRDLREFGWGLAKAANLQDMQLIINEKSMDGLFSSVKELVR